VTHERKHDALNPFSCPNPSYTQTSVYSEV
jgi:hypothetical protein